MLLIKSDISKQRKKELRKLMVFFADVSLVDVHAINWSVNYDRNNQTYRLLITICHLVVKGLIQTKSDGSVKMMDFLDEQRMCHLYEKFILEYYKKHYYPQITASALHPVHNYNHHNFSYLRSSFFLQSYSFISDLSFNLVVMIAYNFVSFGNLSLNGIMVFP